MEYNKEQRIICKKYNAPFVETFPFWKVGIARNVIEGTQPINGLRHLPKDDTSGWYIWAGEEFSNDRDFFLRGRVSTPSSSEAVSLLQAKQLGRTRTTKCRIKLLV